MTTMQNRLENCIDAEFIDTDGTITLVWSFFGQRWFAFHSIITERNVALDVFQYIVTIYPEDQRKPRNPLVKLFNNKTW